MNKEKAEQRLKEILAEKIELQKKQLSYREANAIEFFDCAPAPGPNPKQNMILDAWLDPYYKIFTFSGGNRGGKTLLGVLLTFATMFGEYTWDNKTSRKGSPTPLGHLFPNKKPRKVRYIGQDWEKHIKTVVIPELEKWWPKNRAVKKRKNNQGIDAYWEDIKTNSTLEIMSNGQESDLHEGWSGDLIVYDEPPKREIRVANARGLVDRLGREFFGMTLLKEAWVDREVIKAVQPDGRPDRTVFNVHIESYDNVGYGITREGLDQFSKTLTEDEKSARLLGIPSYMSGLVYPQFSRDVHLIERFEVPIDWMVDIAIDIHPREKQAILFMATDPRDDKYAVQEIWGNGDPDWIGGTIIKAIKYNTYRVNKIIIDPLSKGDKNNPQTMFDKVAKVLYPYGYTLEVAMKDKEQGILDVKKHLKGPNNMPSLFFFDDLVRTLFEIEGYMWDKDQKPMDENDHMMENLYRLLLLNTRYVEPYNPELELFDNYDHYSGRNTMTGY